ncbi:OmpA family protein [Polaromonas sp.]|uniref:OmpA family protein n=1 Tax=Polaromonas sp. TaxID=1869339 RepID=UPI002FC8A6EF
MFSQEDDAQRYAVLGFLFGIVVLVVASVIGFGIHKNSAMPKAKPAAAGKPMAAQEAAKPAEPSQAAAQAAADAASVKVENGVVKFYFASGKAELAAGASEALTDVIKGARAGRKLVISGFHDATGDATKNAELARERALAVRAALKTAGVADSQIELKKPEQMAGSGSNAEARRVEISLQ